MKNEEKTKTELSKSKNSELDSINKVNSSLLLKKYNIIELERLDSMYTYQIQKIINDTITSLAVDESLTDVIEIDGKYYIKLTSIGFSNDYLIVASISNDQFIYLSKELESKSKYTFNRGLFIIKANRIISSSKLKIDSDFTDDNSSLEAELKHSLKGSVMIIQGNLIDCYLYKYAPKNY